jgi:hypothetical protein
MLSLSGVERILPACVVLRGRRARLPYD